MHNQCFSQVVLRQDRLAGSKMKNLQDLVSGEYAHGDFGAHAKTVFCSFFCATVDISLMWAAEL